MSILKKHHSISYITARIKQIYFQKTQPDSPWLVPTILPVLSQLLRPFDIGVEFGSGRSTKWLASRCKHLYSVEHHEKWFSYVSKEITGLKNVDYRLRQIDDSTSSTEIGYLDIFTELEKASIDFILNDGKFRIEVAELGWDKLKPGGLMIIDNAERYLSNDFSLAEGIDNNPLSMKKEWASFYDKTKNIRKIWLTDGISSTLILFKP